MPKFCAKNVLKKDKNYFKGYVWVTLLPSLDKFMFHFWFRVAVRLIDVKISDNSRMILNLFDCHSKVFDRHSKVFDLCLVYNFVIELRKLLLVCTFYILSSNNL